MQPCCILICDVIESLNIHQSFYSHYISLLQYILECHSKHVLKNIVFLLCIVCTNMHCMFSYIHTCCALLADITLQVKTSSRKRFDAPRSATRHRRRSWRSCENGCRKPMRCEETRREQRIENRTKKQKFKKYKKDKRIPKNERSTTRTHT